MWKAQDILRFKGLQVPQTPIPGFCAKPVDIITGKAVDISANRLGWRATPSTGTTSGMAS